MPAVAATSAQPVAQKAPFLLLLIFFVVTLFSVGTSAFAVWGLVTVPQPQHWVENEILNGMLVLGVVTFAALQSTALVGLYLRKHWGRDLATIGAGYWMVTIIGIPFALLMWWALHRRWDPGVESNYYKEHPAPPAYVVLLAAVGSVAFLVWLWFLYLYVVPLVQRLTADVTPPIDPNTWYAIVTVALYASLPFWALQVLTFIGLRRRHDWGAVLASLTCVLWTISLIGLPFGIAGLLILWRWEHPALATHTAATPA